MRDSSARVWLAVIVLVGAALRSFRLDWGLPDFANPDGVMYFVRPASRIVAAGDWRFPFPVHPPLTGVLTAAVFAVWSFLHGEPIAAGGPAFYAQLPTLVMLGRGLSVAFSAAAIVVLYLLARPLVGARAALLGAAVFALAPGQVLEAHRNNPDTPLILATLIAVHLAAVADASRRRGLLLGAYLAAGIAGGFKYTGPAAASVPAWFTLTWSPGETWRRRLRWLAAGSALTVVGFVLVCLPLFLDLPQWGHTVWSIVKWSYVLGMPGVDLESPGWIYTRYVYPLLVSLPFMMGWAAHLAGLVGLVLLARRAGRARSTVLAFVVPYFLIMGGATSVIARYYLPLAPFLGLAAGVALERGLASRRRALGVAAVVLVLGYTAGLTISQCRRLGLGPQREVAALIAAEAARSTTPLHVAYPHILVLHYDAIRPLVESLPNVKVVYYPPAYQNIRLERGESPPEAERLAEERRWVEEKDVGVVVLPSWVRNAARRERPTGATVDFYRHLADGSLGFRLAGEFRTHFWTEPLYTWAEPMLDTHWETAIAGYDVFVRAPEPR